MFPHFGYSGMGWGGMLLGAVISIALLVGLVILVVWAVRRIAGRPTLNAPQTPGSSSAKEIVQMRYAKGEITREEYQKLLEDLNR